MACEKHHLPGTHEPPLRTKQRRNFDTIAQDAQCIAQAAAVELGLSTASAQKSSERGSYSGDDLGLSLRDLETVRWGVSAETAKDKLIEAGLPHEGRRARLTYSWRSILCAEGVDPLVAATATRQSHPELFDDFLDGAAAARFIGFRSDSVVRKMVLSGEIPAAAYVLFGSRPIRRFRPAFLTAARRRRLDGKLV